MPSGGGGTAVLAAFHTAILTQGLVLAMALAFLWLLRTAVRGGKPGLKGDNSNKRGALAWVLPSGEPRGRRTLRISFGLLWLIDGLLQAQPQMPLGLPSQVIIPSAQGSPSWARALVAWGAAGWTHHPATAAAAAIWIQAGLGLWLLAVPGGRWSRLGGTASVLWGLAVWGFGEAFGGILAPGLSWLDGAPGAVLLYVAAGALLTLPPGAWRTPRPGRALLGLLGAFFLVMAALQAWPGNGFWRGGRAGATAGMVTAMAQTPQPAFLSSLLTGFARFAAANAVAVNLTVVLALVVLAAGCLLGAARGRSGAVRTVMIAGSLFCLAVWVLVQDLGVLGGLGTDPNSMLPTIALLAGGYLALSPGGAGSPGPGSGSGAAGGADASTGAGGRRPAAGRR